MLEHPAVRGDPQLAVLAAVGGRAGVVGQRFVDRRRRDERRGRNAGDVVVRGAGALASVRPDRPHPAPRRLAWRRRQHGLAGPAAPRFGRIAPVRGRGRVEHDLLVERRRRPRPRDRPVRRRRAERRGRERRVRGERHRPIRSDRVVVRRGGIVVHVVLVFHGGDGDRRFGVQQRQALDAEALGRGEHGQVEGEAGVRLQLDAGPVQEAGEGLLQCLPLQGERRQPLHLRVARHGLPWDVQRHLAIALHGLRVAAGGRVQGLPGVVAGEEAAAHGVRALARREIRAQLVFADVGRAERGTGRGAAGREHVPLVADAQRLAAHRRKDGGHVRAVQVGTVAERQRAVAPPPLLGLAAWDRHEGVAPIRGGGNRRPVHARGIARRVVRQFRPASACELGGRRGGRRRGLVHRRRPVRRLRPPPGVRTAGAVGRAHDLAGVVGGVRRPLRVGNAKAEMGVLVGVVRPAERRVVAPFPCRTIVEAVAPHALRAGSVDGLGRVLARVVDPVAAQHGPGSRQAAAEQVRRFGAQLQQPLGPDDVGPRVGRFPIGELRDQMGWPARSRPVAEAHDHGAVARRPAEAQPPIARRVVAGRNAAVRSASVGGAQPPFPRARIGDPGIVDEEARQALDPTAAECMGEQHVGVVALVRIVVAGAELHDRAADDRLAVHRHRFVRAAALDDRLRPHFRFAGPRQRRLRGAALAVEGERSAGNRQPRFGVEQQRPALEPDPQAARHERAGEQQRTAEHLLGAATHGPRPRRGSPTAAGEPAPCAAAPRRP